MRGFKLAGQASWQQTLHPNYNNPNTVLLTAVLGLLLGMMQGLVWVCGVFMCMHVCIFTNGVFSVS